MPTLKEQLIKTYESGKSVLEVAQTLNYSPAKVRYWMNKYSIKMRGHSEAAYLKQNPNGDPFNIKVDLSPNEKILYGLGIGIYWGEGNKMNKRALRVTNSDPKMIKIFAKFLRVILGVRNDKIKYSLICFNDSDPGTVRLHWSHMLNISPEKFGKITQIPTQGKGTYKKKSEFGVCIIYVGNIKLREWMKQQIQLIEDYNFV